MNAYQDCQISKIARHQNNIIACRVIETNKDEKSVIVATPTKQEVKIFPKDIEVTIYEKDMYVDCALRKQNGIVVAAERIGLTPPTFIPVTIIEEDSDLK